MGEEKSTKSLFVFSDDDYDESDDSYDDQPVSKKIKLEEPDIDCLSDSDWEDVFSIPEISAQLDQPNEFNIIIRDQRDEEEENRKRKLLQLVKEKQQRVSLQYLSMVIYILHARIRNLLLSNQRVLRKLKKLLPDLLMSNHLKKFNKLRKNLESMSPEAKLELDKHLIYILKYLIKWFRKNFKHDSNGLRVLGYMPTGKDAKDYFPQNAKPILSEGDLLSIVKKFKHNRDTGAEVFTALLRSIGFESRLVFSLPLLNTSKNEKRQPKLNQEILKVNKDNDLIFPYFWTELINPIDPSEIIIIETQCFYEEEKNLTRIKRFGTSPKGNLHRYYTDRFYPIQSQFCQMSMHYVLSFSKDNLIIDVSPRYMKDISYRWFNRLDLRTELGRSSLLLQSLIRIFNRHKEYTHFDNLELDGLRNTAMINYVIPTNFSAMKRSPNFITESTLRYNEVIIPNSECLKIIKLDSRKEPVYFKNSLLIGKSESQWKFLGRSVKPEEIGKPIKTTKL